MKQGIPMSIDQKLVFITEVTLDLYLIVFSMHSQSQILSESLEMHAGNKELQCIKELDGIIP